MAVLLAALSSEACGGHVETTGAQPATPDSSGTPAQADSGPAGVSVGGGSPNGDVSPGRAAGGTTQMTSPAPLDGAGSGGELGAMPGTGGSHDTVGDAGAGGEAGQVSVSANPACSYRRYRCEGALLFECDPDRNTMHLVQQCAGAAFCDVLSGRCLEPFCTPGSAICMGATLAVCAPDLLGWVTAERCAIPSECDPVAQMCREPLDCDRRCNGANFMGCTADQQSYVTIDVCASPLLCGPAGCEPPVCLTGAYRCEGSQLLRCNESLTDFVLIKTCDSASLCDADIGACLVD